MGDERRPRRRCQSIGGGGGGSVGGWADDERRVAGEAAQRILVEDAGHGLVQFGELVAEVDGAFEEDLDGDGPELVVVGSGIVTQEVFGVDLLHSGEDGAGYLGEIGELLFEMFVFLGLGDEIDIREGVRHFVKTHVAIGCVARDAADEIIPGEIDTGLIHMSHERTGIETVVIVVPQNKDIVEVVEFELFQSKGQLHGRGAHQDGHLGGLFHLYIMEVLGMLEQEGAEKKFTLVFQAKTIIITEVTGNHGMIKGFTGDKTFELMLRVKALGKKRDWPIE